MVWKLLDPQPVLSFDDTIALKKSSSTIAALNSKKDRPLLNCIYDKNCSNLFKAIELNEWSKAAVFLETAAWPGISIIPDFSPKQQAMTMVTCLDDDSEVVWSRLPLQLAILRRAPFEIIGRLIDLAPHTCSTPDHDGNLALHLALLVDTKHVVLDYILYNNPDAVAFPNAAGLAPVQSALRAKDSTARTRAKIFHPFLIQASSPIKDTRVHQSNLVCDYDDSCSPLYKEIQNQDWDSVCHFLETGAWPEPNLVAQLIGWVDERNGWTIQSETTNPKEQAMTSVSKLDDFGNLKWRRLPIHLAIICNAPLRVVQELVRVDPESADTPDFQGMLPLHLALYYNSNDAVIACLLEAFPESANIRGMNGLSPIEIAQEGENPRRGDILRDFVSATQKSTNKTKPETQ